MQPVQIASNRQSFVSTARTDHWWLAPAATAAGLLVFFGYLTLRAFNGTYVWFDPYVSPTVAPPVFTPASGYPGAVPVDHAWFGVFPTWWPSFLPQSPAFFMPALAITFRLTCYYYRGAYYKAFFMTPPNCAVPGMARGYRGEKAFAAFFRGGRFGIGVGTVVMLINAALLSSYAFGCHSWRHLIGGRMDCFSCGAATSPRYSMWKVSSWLNERHMACAWLSLVWVAFTDFYIYLVSSGTLHDLSTW
jgi:hypothetical protein